MVSFNAGSVVDPLDFDFSDMANAPHLIAGLADVKGTIREPTSLQVQAFANAQRRELVRQRQEIGDVDEKDPVAVIAALEKMDDERTVAAQKRSAEILTALCSGKPTAAELILLPHRVMHMFGEWIAKEVLDPEASTGAGKAQVLPLRSSSAG
jgi:hypothetical protein